MFLGVCGIQCSLESVVFNVPWSLWYLLIHAAATNFVVNNYSMTSSLNYPVAEFKEFERRFKFKPRFKYGSLHLKLCQMFQDLNRVLTDLNRG